MKYLFLLLFLLVYIFSEDYNLGYTDTSELHTHITYMFMHVNPAHLILNGISFFFMFRTLEKITSKATILCTIIPVATIASFLSEYSTPTVGASGMLYAMIGILLGMVAFRRQMISNRSQFAVFILTVVLSMLISYFKHSSNFMLHLYSLIFGMISQIVIVIKRKRG